MTKKHQKKTPAPAKGEKAAAVPQPAPPEAPASGQAETTPKPTAEPAAPTPALSEGDARAGLILDGQPAYMEYLALALDNKGEVKDAEARTAFERHCAQHHPADLAAAAVQIGAFPVLRAAIPGRLQRVLELCTSCQPTDQGEWPEAARLLLEREGEVLDSIMDRFRPELDAASVDVGALNRATNHLAACPNDANAGAVVSGAIELLRDRSAWFRAAIPAPATAAPAPELQKGHNFTTEELALAALVSHPEWTNQQIAAHVGCHPKHLSRLPKFKAARAIERTQSRQKAIGAKGRDGDMGNIGLKEERDGEVT